MDCESFCFSLQIQCENFVSAYTIYCFKIKDQLLQHSNYTDNTRNIGLLQQYIPITFLKLYLRND